MHTILPILAVLLSCSLRTYAQGTTPNGAIVPFSTLPVCADKCGPLYDAQGACTPPNVASVDQTCFCQYKTLQGLYSSAADICNGNCDAGSLQSVQQWFTSYCQGKDAAATTSTQGSAPTATQTGAGAAASTVPPTSVPSNGTWISGHWQWLVAVVVIALAIIIGWIAACLLRRRYLRRKEREFELRPPAAPWANGGAHPGPLGVGAPGPYPSANIAMMKGKNKEGQMRSPLASPTSMGGIGEKKKWVVKERT